MITLSLTVLRRCVLMLGLLLVVGVAPVFGQTAASRDGVAEVVLRRTISRIVQARETGHEYQLFIALPKSFDHCARRYPVLYLLDGDVDFGLATGIYERLSAEGIIPETIIVGIGYGREPHHPERNRQRGRDLLRTRLKESRNPDAGQGDAFATFIRDELFDTIEADYRGDADDRTLVGHSFGGLFALSMLLENPEAFRRYVILSPSLWYDEEWAMAEAQREWEQWTDLPAQVFLAVGENEQEDIMVDPWRRLTSLLKQRKFESMRFTFKLYQDHGHGSMVPAALSDGWLAVFAGREIGNEEAKRCIGTYRTEDGDVFTISQHDTVLALAQGEGDPFRLVPDDNIEAGRFLITTRRHDRFIVRGEAAHAPTLGLEGVRFTFDEQGKAIELAVRRNGRTTIARRGVAAPPEPPAPATESVEHDFNLYHGLLHAHTKFSNGMGVPDEAYQMARDAGVDFFAITEHDSVTASGDDGIFLTPARYQQLRDAALRHTEPGVFVALYGQEMSSIRDGNHVNVFNAAEMLNLSASSFTAFYSEWLPAHPEVPFVQLNHPKITPDRQRVDVASGRNNHLGIKEYGMSYPRLVAAADKYVGLLEIIDGLAKLAEPGPTQHLGTNEGAYRFYLNQGFHLGVSVGQDNHRRDWGLATRGRLGCWARTLTVEGIYESLGAMRTFASEDEDLEVWFEINDVPMGGTTILGSREACEIMVRVRDPGEPNADYHVALLYDDAVFGPDAGVIHEKTMRGDGALSFSHRPRPGGYYFVRITQQGELEDLVWTSPIWIASRAHDLRSQTGHPGS